MATKAQPTGRYVYHCKSCGHTTTRDFDDSQYKEKSTAYRCEGCGKWRIYGVALFGRKSDKVKCDARCEGAHGPNCDCQCGGTNHGRAYLA